MGYSSQPGQLGLGIQSVKGTPVAATRFVPLRGGSLGGDSSLLVPDAEIGGHRDITNAYRGPIGYSGDLDMYPRMQGIAMLLKGVLGASQSTFVAGTNEVQTLTETGTPTGGTFKLYFRGGTTTELDFDSTAGEIQTALEALSTIAPGDVTASGGPLGTDAVTLTFGGAYATQNVPPVEVVALALTGGTSPTIDQATSTPGVPAVGTHVITPADTLPWLTVEERISTDFDSYQYTDGRVDSLRLEAEATGYVMGSATIAALTQIADFTAQANPDWDDTPMQVGSQVIFRFNGADLKAKSFSFEVNNNMETDDFVLGSISAADMTPKRREVKLGASYRPVDNELWRAAMYGSPSATSASAGPAYRGPVQIEISTFETIGDVVDGTPFSLTLDFDDVVIAPHKVTPQGDDVVQNDLEMTAIRPDAAVPIVTATVVNDLATVS